ncbi:MAG: ATP-binding protein [Ferruginibacter sp.]
MKKLLIIISIVLNNYPAISQDSTEIKISKTCDSIFSLLKKETDPDKMSALNTSFYTTSIDGFPLLILDLGQKLLTLGRERKNIMIESAGWSAVAQGYRLTGNYVKALELHRKAVALSEQSGNKAFLWFALNQMGHIYKDRLETDKALSLYRSALFYANQSKGDNWWFPTTNLAATFLNAGNLDSAMFYAKTALNSETKSMAMGTNSIVQSIMGSVYSKSGDQITAQKYFAEGVVIAKRTQSPRFLNMSYVAIAEHFNHYRQYDSAAWYCKMAIEAVQNTPSAYMSLKPARMLIDYFQNKNADSTVKFWKVYSAANDSLNSTRTNQQIQMMTMEEEQRKRDIEAESISYKNKIRTNLLLGGAGIFLLLAVFLYRNNRQKQKTNIVLKKTLTDLKSTQTQLIQSEKMASLGELTAGIAHEIQNPLNFVNNFSEVNTELIDEAGQEIDKGNINEVKVLLHDIKENELKINHHGKRADGIVKGMLQHSRSSSGTKEPTDINALCDEYLRLSYHGLRAKDKSFNASFKTDFDDSLREINIIPQDIGRVVLNLLTNAFYVVNEKKQLNIPGYEPVVSVITKKIADKVEISVIDNGNGIPESVKEKIFQPFFTTKPTGQGTGLGLSMSYDIVTKGHGGELKVETKEGEGTQFIIILNT